MATRSISFTVDDKDLALLDDLAATYGHGDRSEFLRIAMREMRIKRRIERFAALRQEALEERGGKTYSTEETLELIDRLRVV